MHRCAAHRLVLDSTDPSCKRPYRTPPDLHHGERNGRRQCPLLSTPLPSPRSCAASPCSNRHWSATAVDRRQKRTAAVLQPRLVRAVNPQPTASSAVAVHAGATGAPGPRSANARSRNVSRSLISSIRVHHAPASILVGPVPDRSFDSPTRDAARPALSRSSDSHAAGASRMRRSGLRSRGMSRSGQLPIRHRRVPRHSAKADEVTQPGPRPARTQQTLGLIVPVRVR